jgi:peptide chain release factor
MILQISSGQGPAECELAVGKLFEALQKEYPEIEKLDSHQSRYAKDGGYTSILFATERDLSELEGTVQWICQSPYRLHHKRKNWYVDISVIPEAESVCKEDEIRFERFHCGGKGGQNVNKVETGVRLIHIPTGLVVTSTAERSQYQNKKNALMKLNVLLHQKEREAQRKQTNDAWREHTKIVRGNPVRTYVGMDFKRK